jgi:uncharacterized protein YlbG (UPF0298 family)
MSMDNKFLVLYVAHFINDFSLSQYYKLKNELPDGYDIVWWLDDTCISESYTETEGIKFIKFPHFTIHPKPLKKYWIDPMKYMEVLYKKDNWFSSYDYYWIVEYDVYFSGNWNYFFNVVDKYKEDFVGSAFTMYKDDVVPHSYSNNIIFESNNLHKRIKSCISIYRISNKALKCISDYGDIDFNNKNDVRNYLYEIYIPTILYNNGYSILSLNSEKIIIKDERYDAFDYSNINFVNYYDDCGFIDDAINTFWWNITFYNKDEMNKPNKLYTRYKPDKY